MKKIIIGLLIINLLYGSSYKEFILGETKNFAERDMLELIQEHLVNNKSEIEKKAAKMREQAKENVKNYKPEGLKPLSPALEDKVFYPDLSYTLDRDITDQYGKILYKKGFKFNPADYVKLSYAMVVIDGSNKKEVEWFKNSGFANQLTYKLLLSDGSFYKLNQELKQEVFYLMPSIREKFKITKTPSIIKQIDNKIQVNEICISCKHENQKGIVK